MTDTFLDPDTLPTGFFSDTEDNWGRFAESRYDAVVGMCLREVCHHSRNSLFCMAERQIPNFWTPQGGGHTISAQDYETCGCGSLIQWDYMIPGNKGFGEEVIIEPHTKDCWHTRNDPGGYMTTIRELYPVREMTR